MANDVRAAAIAGVDTRFDFTAYVLLFGRLCFAADFMLFGARTFANPSIIYKLLEAHHLPGVLVYPTMVLQFGCGLLVLLGLQTRLAAAALGWFCIVAPSIFWLDSLEHLSRDYAAAGGFLLLVLFGPGPISLDARLGRDVVVSIVPRLFANQALIDRVMLVELVAGLALVVGWSTRQAAFVLLAWSVVLAVTIHNPGYDFAIFGSDFGAVMTKNFLNRGAATFFKDVTMIGALCVLIVYGPGALSRDARTQ